MRLTTTLFEPAATATKRTRDELRLHGAISWPEEATAESLVELPARLIDVDAGSFGVAGLPFRAGATLDLLAPEEIDDELLSSVLKERREALLRSPGSGKTTLLDAAGRLLYQLEAQLNDDLPSSSLLRDDDIRNGQTSTRLSVKAVVGTEAESWDARSPTASSS
jgi:hypothetical protein